MAMNKRRSTELSLVVSGVPRAVLQAEILAQQQNAIVICSEDNRVQHSNVTANTSQMNLNSHSFSAISAAVGSELPPIQMSSTANNIRSQATVNIKFNLQLTPQWHVFYCYKKL